MTRSRGTAIQLPLMAEASWTRKDLIGIEPLERSEIETIHSLAADFKAELKGNRKKLPHLLGKTVVNFFIEPSTRTRIAFEIAAKRLSADVTLVEGAKSSLSKGESLRDTAEVIQALDADIIILRHSAAGAPQYLSKILEASVINAGDGAHEHPTQALLDTFTMKERLGSLDGCKVTILGDILFSRVARSNIWALQKLGASVTLAGPSTLVPETFTSAMGVKVSYNLRDALSEADVVMLLRIQHERQTSTHFPGLGEYKALFGLNQSRDQWLKPEAIIMHPGPINRGVELDSQLADGPRSVILDQVTNGIFTRMAVLHLCLSVT